jgi:class 3 adenylate cyclase
MNLRYRLFLWVGTLFLLAFIVSFFWEGHLTKEKLERAEQKVRADILELNEQKREHLETFLSISITEAQAQVSSLLQSIGEYKQLIGNYAEQSHGGSKGTWFSAANSLMANKTIDFIQNTNEGELQSLIIPNIQAMQGGCRFAISDTLSWVTLSTGERPYLGIRFTLDPNKALTRFYSFMPGTNPDVYILFKTESIIPFRDLWCTRPVDPSLASFLKSVEEAAAYVQNAPKDPHEKEKWIEKKMSESPLPTAPQQPFRCTPKVDKNLDLYLRQLLMKDDELLMIWRLTSLFTDGPFSEAAPVGIARFPYEEFEGEGFLSRDLFYNTPLFDEAKFYSAHPPNVPCWHPANGVAIIQPPEGNRLFFGDTIQTNFEGRIGYLTMARDIDTVLKELVLALHQTAFLVHNDKVVTAYFENGDKIELPELPLNEMLSRKNGILTWKGSRYFYLHMIPIKSADLHFFVINLEEKEFALVRQLETGAGNLIAAVSFDMRIVAFVSLIIVLLLLHRLSKKITRPITTLATAAEEIGKGRLEEAILPQTSGGKSDEVFILCKSFEVMVNGLKEKEKVKAVLNKVVSQEIAHEILKGAVHLGGEEKSATVLFGDIRGFTKLTSKMAPTEVVELLNTCMTKISTVVDKNDGVIDKYVGDEVMALFGAPIEKPESTVKAVESAVEMMEVLHLWNRERKNRGLPSVEMGIGIHTGVMLVGNMGAENRLNYTVLGSNVNLAARLCDAAKPGEILITRFTYEAPGVKERIDAEYIGPMTFRGFDLPIDVYRVKGFM